MTSRLKDPHAWNRISWGLLKFLLVGHVFQRYVGGIGPTSGVSMVPTIPDRYRGGRAWVLYSALHRRGRWLKVGDVVTYTHPLFPSESGCKRIIGMPGDFVSVVTPGRLDEDIEKVDVEGKWAALRDKVVQVPEGHCWVAGDNLEWSRDSRLFGPLPLGLVQAKVLAVVLPMKEAKWLGHDVDVRDPLEGEHDWVAR